jgi:acetolactate synthase-1/2/3 large subunit
MMTLLNKSARPLAILGGGGWTEAGRAAIARFLRASHLPVCVGFRRQSLYDGTHATYAGDLGVGSDPALVAKARDADLILAIGTRLGEAVTQGYALLDLAGATSLVHVHAEATEIGRVHRPALGIACDLNAFAQAAAALPPASATWRDWTAELRALRQAALEVPDYPEEPNVAACMHALQAQLAPDAVVTCDAGNFATWANRFLSFGDRQRFIGPTNGAMGYGVPAAIGAAAAFPGRQVVALVGDGGALMTGQEIATAFHHGLNPVVIVFNNQMYGTIRMYQERTFPARVSGTALTNPDFARFIEAFGGHGEVVAQTGEFAPALKRALAAGKPALIEVRQHPDRITSRATIADLRAAGGGVVHAKPAASKRAEVARAPKKPGKKPAR